MAKNKKSFKNAIYRPDRQRVVQNFVEICGFLICGLIMKICGYVICRLLKNFACPPLCKTQFEILSFQKISQGIDSARLGIDSCALKKFTNTSAGHILNTRDKYKVWNTNIHTVNILYQ
jgi:hypothetical protein